MNVAVTIVVSSPPTEQDFENLNYAAITLTNDRTSITIHRTQDGDRSSLITQFTMKPIAQYKVVEQIDREFKFWTVALEGYEDMIISFPKSVKRHVYE